MQQLSMTYISKQPKYQKVAKLKIIVSIQQIDEYPGDMYQGGLGGGI